MADISALVVEGGAMRGVFSTGLLDAFLEKGFNPFDCFIGVSAGAGNLAAYLAEMPGRNLRIYTDYSLRPEFIDAARFLRGATSWTWTGCGGRPSPRSASTWRGSTPRGSLSWFA